MANVIKSKGWDIFVYFYASNWLSRLQYENIINTVAISEGESQTTPNIQSKEISCGSIHTIVQYAI